MKKSISTIREAQELLSSELQELVKTGRLSFIPGNVRVKAVFHHTEPKLRKIRETAAFDGNFELEAEAPDAILLTFAPAKQKRYFIEGDEGAMTDILDVTGGEVAMTALIRALSRAQSRPTGFVGLKWFRDNGMSVEPALAGVDRAELLRIAINRGIVRTGKVPNPKNPDFPVTSIWLENSAPEVQYVIATARKRASFNPVTVRGESLSETVVRARR